VAAALVAALAALFLVAQLFPAERSNPPVVWNVECPAEVRAILAQACFDCHSHETRWPWYSRIVPVSWWVVGHVEDARSDLNFSDWPAFDLPAQEDALRAIEKQIEQDRMPLRSYRLLHRGARLGPKEREILLRWARSGT
jgi:hypothetical protein